VQLQKALDECDVRLLIRCLQTTVALTKRGIAERVQKICIPGGAKK
jgi:hypothetical protein